MRTRQVDLLLIMALSCTNLLWVLRMPHILIVGVLLAFPQVFLFPGYALTEVISFRRPLENVRCAVFSIGLSIAIDVLSGLGLNSFPSIGLKGESWAVWLSILTCSLALLALILRRSQRSSRRAIVWSSLRIKRHIVPALLTALAMMMAVGSIVYSDYSAKHQVRVGFTQLWMIQADQAKNSCAITIGVDSYEFKLMKYHVVMSVNGTQTNTWPVQLSPQKTWEVTVPMSVSASASSTVSVQLYQESNLKVPYRLVHLQIRALGGSKQGPQCTTIV